MTTARLWSYQGASHDLRAEADPPLISTTIGTFSASGGGALDVVIPAAAHVILWQCEELVFGIWGTPVC